MPFVTLEKTLSRFWARVKKTKSCWNWVGSLSGDGYGTFTISTKRVRAHRFCYEQIKGIIPNNFCLDHLCRNIRCVNPDHLEPVTQAENIRRGKGSGGLLYKRPKYCKRGHKFTKNNAYIHSPTNWRCKACTIMNAKKRYEKLKSQGYLDSKEFKQKTKENFIRYVAKKKRLGLLEEFRERRRQNDRNYRKRKKLVA